MWVGGGGGGGGGGERLMEIRIGNHGNLEFQDPNAQGQSLLS